MAAQSLARRLLEKVQQARRFLSHDVWLERLDRLPRKRAMGYRAARVLHRTLQGLFFSDSLSVRAAALTYYTVLSLVPLLAFVFALLKGFGAYETLVQDTIRPYVRETFSANQPLQQAIDKVLDIVERTGVASLGFLGLVLVLYSGTRLLRNIEGSLNALWQVEGGRGPLQQVTDYLAIIVITPLCMLLAGALGTFSQLASAVRSVGELVSLGDFAVTLFGMLLPAAVVFIGLYFLYLVMPNTKVRAGSALWGALIGAVLWWAVLVAHVRFQVGVARFNALYASFGAIPIFLVWLNLSWTVVLVGAQIAATHQREGVLAQQRRAEASEQVTRETVAVTLMLELARAFSRGDPPLQLAALADRLSVPPPLLRSIISRLSERGFVLQTGPAADPAVALGRAAEGITTKMVLDIMRRPAGAEDRVVAPLENVPPAVAQVLEALDRELERSRANLDLKQLASDAASTPEPARRDAPSA
jgi:membrane protein